MAPCLSFYRQRAAECRRHVELIEEIERRGYALGGAGKDDTYPAVVRGQEAPAQQRIVRRTGQFTRKVPDEWSGLLRQRGSPGAPCARDPRRHDSVAANEQGDEQRRADRV